MEPTLKTLPTRPRRARAPRAAILVVGVGLALGGPAHAQPTAVVGNGDVANFLRSIREVVIELDPSDVEIDGFGDADVAVVGRLVPEGPSAAFLRRIEDHVEAGKGLILYWDGAAMAFDEVLDDYRFAPTRQLGWFEGTVGAGVNLLVPSPIVASQSGHELWPVNIPDEFDWPDFFPQFFLTVDGVDPMIELVAHYRGDGSPAFPGASYPVFAIGRVCRARVAVYPINIGDVLRAGALRAMLIGSIRWAREPPGPRRGPCPRAPDYDGDGIDMPADNCPDEVNPGQEDGDGDAIGDACDPCPADRENDRDADELCADADNCPLDANPEQEDGDGDGVGDACDACPGVAGSDVDGDGHCPGDDNCPLHSNPDQADLDGDGIGDICDPERDGDGLSNNDEVAAGTSPVDDDSDDDGLADGAEPAWDQDTDGDGLINAMDPDSDDDGLSDGVEAGVTRPLAGTDLGRGIFRPDADPETTTDPLVADTDRGGADDGVEDIVRNGRIDPGEGDPNDPSDDGRFLPRDAGPDEPDVAGDAGPADASDGGSDADTGPRPGDDARNDAEGPPDVASASDASDVGKDSGAETGDDTGPRPGPDASAGGGDDEGGSCSCGVAARGAPGALAWLVLVALFGWRRRQSRTAARSPSAAEEGKPAAGLGVGAAAARSAEPLPPSPGAAPL